jgi:hypothetical protein
MYIHTYNSYWHLFLFHSGVCICVYIYCTCYLCENLHGLDGVLFHTPSFFIANSKSKFWEHVCVVIVFSTCMNVVRFDTPSSFIQNFQSESWGYVVFSMCMNAVCLRWLPHLFEMAALFVEDRNSESWRYVLCFWCDFTAYKCLSFPYKVLCVWVGREENIAKKISARWTFAFYIEFSPYFLFWKRKNRTALFLSRPTQTQSTLRMNVVLFNAPSFFMRTPTASIGDMYVCTRVCARTFQYASYNDITSFFYVTYSMRGSATYVCFDTF